MSEILTCEALTKCYDKDKTALDGVDLPSSAVLSLS